MWGNSTQSGHTECNLLFLRYRPFVSVLSLRFFKDTFQIGVREYFLFDLFCQSVLYLSNTTFSVYILSVILLSFLLFSFSLFIKPFSIFISVLFFDVILHFFTSTFYSGKIVHKSDWRRPLPRPFKALLSVRSKPNLMEDQAEKMCGPGHDKTIF